MSCIDHLLSNLNASGTHPPSAASVLVSAKTPAVIAKKKVAKIAKQKPAHGSKCYTEAERNVILGKKKAGVPLSTLKKEYGVTPNRQVAQVY